MENTISDAELAALRTITLDELPALTPAVMPEQTIQYAEVTVSSAEILALNSTPKVLVSSPGAGKVLEFISAVLILDYNSAAYATNGDLTIANNSGTAMSNTVLLANLLAATADKMVGLQSLDTANTGVVLLEDEPLELQCATGDPVSGDSPLRVKIAYRVHTTGL